jgi:hypothetical protein
LEDREGEKDSLRGHLGSTEVGGEESDKEESLKGSLSPRKVGGEEG